MKKVTEKFIKTLARHKKIITAMAKLEDKTLIIPAQYTSKELALAYAECKCEKCKATENLQYHHIVQRSLKPFMDFWKYASQRHYWANILILCKTCHQEVESRGGNSDRILTIPISMIDKVRKKYEIKA